MMEHLADALAPILTARERAVLVRPGKTPAAVLVPLLAIDGEPHLLFTRRARGLRHHEGQVAFPGGCRHPGDVDLVATALREAQEEIGLDPADVRLLGPLDDIETMATEFVITPYVGLVPHPYGWTLCRDEVDVVFTVPLRLLDTPEAERRELWDFEGQQVPIEYYPVGEHVIWGATHRITRNLLAVLRTIA